jgi:pectate lyase
MNFQMKAAALAVAMVSGGAFAANTGGFATTEGGNVSGAKSVTVSTMQGMIDAIAAARLDANGKKITGGAYPLIITYTGNEDSLIAQIVKDSTIDANHNCPKGHWGDTYRAVEIKEFTKGITIIGANGSSANFGIPIIKSSNVVIKNMKIGALGGASNDADMIRIDTSSNIVVDHNELFAVNNECNGSPDGDLTFESAIDIKKDSHNITVSYNYIHDSKKVGLDGSSASDISGGREITYHHNVYYNVNGRLPLQRGGWIHVYNNFYDKITSSGINIRTGGYALIEKNWFQNSLNPVTCRYDVNNCGHWDLRGNNTTSAADNAKYNITWDIAETGDINADTWTTTAAFPKTLTYTYEPVSAQCVKDKLASYAGVGKNGAVLTASACGTTTSSSSSSAAPSSSSSSSAAPSSSSSSSAPPASSSSSSKASSSSSSKASSSSSSSKSSSSSSSAPSGAVTIQESTTGFCHVDGAISTSNSGYTGTGYANLSNSAGAGVDWSVNAPTAANYTVTFRYANGGSSATTSGKVLVNGVVVQNSSSLFSKTASKTTWTNKSFTVALKAGANRIRVEAGASAEFADIDYLTMSGVTAVACQ